MRLSRCLMYWLAVRLGLSLPPISRSSPWWPRDLPVQSRWIRRGLIVLSNNQPGYLGPHPVGRGRIIVNVQLCQVPLPRPILIL